MGALRVVVGGDDGTRARVSRKTSRTRRVVRAVHDVDVFIIGLFAHGAVEDVARVRRGAVVGFIWERPMTAILLLLSVLLIFLPAIRSRLALRRQKIH